MASIAVTVGFYTLASCTGSSAQQRLSEAEACLGSFGALAYEPSPEGDLQGRLLSESWYAVAKIPAAEGENIGHNVVVEVLSSPDYAQVWVLQDRAETTSALRAYSFAVFDQGTRSWETIPSVIADSQYFVDEVFVESDGSVLGRINWVGRRDVSTGDDQTILSRFDRATKSWTFIPELQDIPLTANDGPYSFARSKVIRDRNGEFLIIASGDSIYRYSSVSSRISIIAALEHIDVINASVDPTTDLLYLQVQTGSYATSLSSGEILTIDLSDSSISTVEPPVPHWPGAGSILVDHAGRLWYGAMGWRASDGQWTLLHPDPGGYRFALEQSSGSFPYPPSVYLETQDGRVWFRGLWGGGWVDPVSQTGCWFSTQPNATIVEDETGVVWVSIGDTLYSSLPQDSGQP